MGTLSAKNDVFNQRKWGDKHHSHLRLRPSSSDAGGSVMMDHWWWTQTTRPGKHTKNDGKSPCY